MASIININTANLDQLKGISGIGDKRAQKIIRRRDEKGSPLTLEDLKLMTDIPNTIWDPLIESGVITLGEKDNPQGAEKPAADTDKTSKILGDTIRKLKTEFDQKLNDLSVDFAVRLKNKDREMEVLTEKIERTCRQDVDNIRREAQEREDGLKRKIGERDDRIQRLEELVQENKMKEESSKLSSYYSKIFPKTEDDVLVSEERPSSSMSSTDMSTPRSKGPIPPKMGTFSGKEDWKPYLVQFNHIAKKYEWSEREKLDKLIECLRDRALKFFTTRSSTVQASFQLMCRNLEERFGCKDLPSVVRRQLQDLRQMQDESLEEYAERAQDLAVGGFPETSDDFIQIVATDAFLKGLNDKRAALTAMDKDPEDLDKAVQYVRSALTNQRVILGTRRPEVKRVTFQESETEERFMENSQETVNVRAVYRKEPESPMTKLEARLKKTEEDVQETKKSIGQILDILKGNNSQERSRSPLGRSNSRSPVRDGRCFNCGDEGHFIASCPKPRRRSPQPSRSRSPTPDTVRKDLNFQGLRK